MFEQASRIKLRFDTRLGSLSVEDLWGLPLQSATKVNLDEIALALHGQLRNTGDVVSFVDDRATSDPVVQLRFDIVKHVIEIRKQEIAEAEAAKIRAETKQQLLAALDRKRTNQLETMSEKELLKRLAAL